MQRWRSVGCALQFVLPPLAFLTALTTVIIRKPLQDVHGLERLLLRVGPLVFIGMLVLFVLFMGWRIKGRSPEQAPRADLVSPEPGTTQAIGDSTSVEVEEGQVADTQIRIAEWLPPQRIRLEQSGAWDRALLAMAAIVPVVVVALDGLRLTATAGMGAWLFVLLVWMAIPNRRRSVTFDFGRDAIVTRYGSQHRELGISRLRAIEHIREVTRAKQIEGQFSGGSSSEQLVAWIEPRGKAPVSFLLVESQSSSKTERIMVRVSAFQSLGRDLARVIGVPTSRPSGADSGPPLP